MKATEPKPRRRGAEDNNRHAAKGTTNRVQFNARVSPDIVSAAHVALEFGSNGDVIELLADCAASLAKRAFQVEDGAWYGVWIDKDGQERETESGAATERAALIAAGVARRQSAAL